ncbi:MAG: hypothetical protein QM756_21540 [Polyangiaceae bacterium]
MTTLSVAVCVSYNTGNTRVALGQLLRHLVERDAIDVGLGQLLGRDEARFVQRRQEFQEQRFVDGACSSRMTSSTRSPLRAIRLRAASCARRNQPVGHKAFEKPYIARVMV